MPREVTGADGIKWECVQAYAGVSGAEETAAAARVEGKGDLVHVVCTPSGSAKSVRLELPSEWETSLDDEALVRRIESNRET